MLDLTVQILRSRDLLNNMMHSDGYNVKECENTDTNQNTDNSKIQNTRCVSLLHVAAVTVPRGHCAKIRQQVEVKTDQEANQHNKGSNGE